MPAEALEPISLESLSKQLIELRGLVLDNSNHVLKLHQMHDPLTWKRRLAIYFVGSIIGGGSTWYMLHSAVGFANR
jgi:hypothetical protein